MKKILIATGVMNAGGAETLIMEILRNKSDKLDYIMLIHYDYEIPKGVYDEEIKKLGIPIIYIHSVGSIGTKAYCDEFRNTINEIGHIDVIHSHLNAVGGIICMAAKKVGIKKRIVHCHAKITYRGSKKSIMINEIKLFLMKRYVNKYATDFWACSDDAAKRLFYKSKEYIVIPNVINVREYLSDEIKHFKAKEKAGFEKDSLLLGSVGRIAPIKNYELPIRIISKLRDSGIHADFVCYGRIVDEIYYQKLCELIKSENIESQIHFVGNSNNIKEDIAAFDIMLVPSVTEGFGMAAIESQAAGVYTIASCGVPNLVDVKAGLIDFADINDFDKWISLIQSHLNYNRIDNEVILDCFEKAGFDSKSAVSGIEKLYLD